MIPRADIEITQAVDLASLTTPGADTVEYPHWLGTIHHYSPGLWHAADWEYAQELLDRERETLEERDARAATAEDFELLLDDLYQDDLLASSGCDFGVGAAIWALSAAGFVTASCCSGHEDGGPDLFFAGGPDRAALLLPIAGTCGCGLRSLRGGLHLWAPSIAEAVTLAAATIAERAAFDRLPLPAPRLGEDALGMDGGW